VTATLETRLPRVADSRSGGTPARRAVVRWAWRLFRREWRQQLLVLGLIVLAVAATVVGAAVATNTPTPTALGFGTAQDRATFQAPDPELTQQIASLRNRFGPVDVIEDQTLPIPGSVTTYQLRSQSPTGPFGGPLLSLVSGHFPAGPNQVAMTAGVAADLDLEVGGVWHEGGARQVVGIVENPQDFLDEFVLVAPGQVRAPTAVTVLFDGGNVPPEAIGPNVQNRSSTPSNALNPETISLAGLTLGMLLIALVAVGGFTVLAQRRLRSLGLLASLGATHKNVSLVVRANGALVGLLGALLGVGLGVVAWLAYRPHLVTSAHHVIGEWALPWPVVVLAIVLAVVATYFAASRPARAITNVPIVTALSGRPAPPKQIRRSAVPGIVLLAIAFLVLGYSGSRQGTGGAPALVLGLAVLIPAVILLSPFCLSALARLGARSPVAVRLALRDLARYRARSGSALAAISLGVLIAVIIAVVAAARYGNSLDYAGPNLASNQLVAYTAIGPYGPPAVGGGPPSPPTQSQVQAMARSVNLLASSLGGHDIELDLSSATLFYNGPGRNWNGPVYVATPALLRAFGIRESQVDPTADILTMRPGISSLTGMQIIYGPAVGPKGGGGPGAGLSCPRGSCVANPLIQEMPALPSGTSAPNAVITEHAIHQLGLQTQVAGWLVQTPKPLTGPQINNARLAAAAAGLSVETKNDEPSSSEVINLATAFGIALALAILALSVGLIRSETARDLRTLAATGASAWTRRTLTAATAGALGLLGALIGTAAGYIAVIGWIRGSSLNGGISALGNIPAQNLLLILVGMPLAAAVIGWLLAGREPTAIARQPIE
jgi:putative ABC transport system permease protein